MSTDTDRRRATERLAYSMWQAAGRPHGDSLRFWLDAERQYAVYEKPAVFLSGFQGEATRERLASIILGQASMGIPEQRSIAVPFSE